MVLNFVSGTPFSCLLPAAHALQPMQRDRSISMPKRFVEVLMITPSYAFSIRYIPPLRPGEPASLSTWG